MMKDQTDTDDLTSAFNEAAAEIDKQNGNAPPAPVEAAAEEEAPEVIADQEPVAPAAPAAPPLDPIVFARQQRELEKLRHRVSSDTGRIASLEARVKDVHAAAPAAAPTAAPTVKQVEDAAQSPTKLAQLKKEYPEFAESIEEMRQELREEFKRELQPVLAAQQPIQSFVAQKSADDEFQKKLATVAGVFPDYRTTLNSPEFGSWLKEQPRIVAAAMDSDDPSDAIELLALYKRASVAPPARVSDRLARAVDTTARRQPAVKSFDESDPVALFNHFARQIDAERRA